MKPPIITILTDFGTKDPFVGIMHGVILGRCPEARIVDLCHGIAPQAVGQAAFWLERSVRWFPEGTIHVAVVDPGVGTERNAIVARADGQRFVAPDNGLLDPVCRAAREVDYYAISPERLALDVPSRTFHGRDVFAPVGAELAAGRLSIEQAGWRLEGIVPLRRGAPADRGDRIEGTVVTVDHFGNLITNIDAALIGRFEAPVVSIGSRIMPLCRTYGDVSPGELLALVNSFDAVEVARRDGNAAEALGVTSGEGAIVREAGSITT